MLTPCGRGRLRLLPLPACTLLWSGMTAACAHILWRGGRKEKFGCHCLQVALATTLQRIGGVGLDKLTKTKAASELLQVSKAASTSCHVCDSTLPCLRSGKLGPLLNVEEQVKVG